LFLQTDLLVIACVIALTFAQDDDSLELTKIEEAQNMMMMNPMMMGGGMNGMNSMSGMGRPMMSRNQFPVDYSKHNVHLFIYVALQH
jgi:hypothetical protein